MPQPINKPIPKTSRADSPPQVPSQTAVDIELTIPPIPKPPPICVRLSVQVKKLVEEEMPDFFISAGLREPIDQIHKAEQQGGCPFAKGYKPDYSEEKASLIDWLTDEDQALPQVRAIHSYFIKEQLDFFFDWVSRVSEDSSLIPLLHEDWYQLELTGKSSVIPFENFSRKLNDHEYDSQIDIIVGNVG